MSRRLKPTLADYVLIAINPVLIMGLVGSLIYFLLELLYRGQYPDRLQFCLTSFVFAIVLISRISMEDGLERAAPFGIALAVVVGIALNRFVDYHGAAAESYAWAINWSLMALTWWCAHKLTWDCTTIDDTAEASGRGLLETAGLDRSSDDPADSSPPAAKATAQPPTAAPANLPPPSELSQKRWQQLLDRPRRPHVPGVWIVYFSLASLPIFGLGQLFIPTTATASRRYVFLLLCVYVGCGLALLLTTSFLSLRRYLRTRRLEMPAAMTGNWLAIGGVMVVGLLLFSALLPRPAPEYAISAFTGQLDSADHSASPVSAGSEGVRDREAGPDSGVDHSQQLSDQPPDQSETSAGADTQRTSSGADGQVAGKSGSPSGEKGESGSAAKSAQQAEAKSSGESADKSENNSGQQPENKTSPPSDAQAQSQHTRSPQAQAQQTQSQPAPPQRNPPPADSAAQPASEQPQPANPSPQPAATQPAAPPPAAPPPLPDAGSIFGAMFGSLAGLLKLALYAALIVGVAWGAWRSRTQLREMIAGWLAALRALWRSFFVDPDSPEAAEALAQHQPQPGWSFGDFVDPFATGTAQHAVPAELVKYTFAALEAWGREQGFSRGSDATPHEFVALLGSKHPPLRADTVALANLYSRAVYSQATLPPAAVANLSQLWRLMHAARSEQPVMPG